MKKFHRVKFNLNKEISLCEIQLISECISFVVFNFVETLQFNLNYKVQLLVFNFVETLQLNLNSQVQLLVFNRSIIFFSTELN